MKKVCLNQQTSGYLLRNLYHNIPPYLPTFTSVARTETLGKHCPVCATKRKNAKDGNPLYKALISDIKYARVQGKGEALRELFNKLTGNEITTRWEFINGNEVIAL